MKAGERLATIDTLWYCSSCRNRKALDHDRSSLIKGLREYHSGMTHDTCLPLYTKSTVSASIPAIFWGSSPGGRRTPGRTASTEPHWYGWEECLWCEGQPLKGHELNQGTGIGVLCISTVSPGNVVLVDAPPRATSRSITHSIMKNALFYRSLLLCNIGQFVSRTHSSRQPIQFQSPRTMGNSWNEGQDMSREARGVFTDQEVSPHDRCERCI